MSSVQMQMEKLGLDLVTRKTPLTSSCQYKIVEKTLYIGEVSSLDSRPDAVRGRVGAELDIQSAYHEAYAAGQRLAALAIAACGGERIRQVLRVRVMINCAKGFGSLNAVADGVSNALTECFGSRGRHARTVIGASVLQDNAPVICCAELELKGDINV